jgi:hypothetical protein
MPRRRCNRLREQPKAIARPVGIGFACIKKTDRATGWKMVRQRPCATSGAGGGCRRSGGMVKHTPSGLQPGSHIISAGLASTTDDLYVADFATGTIYQAVKDAIVHHPPVIVAEDLVAPEGMTINNDDNLLVAETRRGRMVRIDLGTHHMDAIADDLAVGDPAIAGWLPTGAVLTGVTVSLSGTNYVAGDVDNLVYRIRKTH